MKNSNKCALIRKWSLYFIFFAFIILVILAPLNWIFIEKNKPMISIIEERGLATIPGLKISEFRNSLSKLVHGDKGKAFVAYSQQFISRDYQLKLESGLSDRFPLRMTFIKFSKWMDRQIIGLTYLFVSDPAIPADANSGYFIMRDKSRLIKAPEIFDSSVKKDIDIAVNNYQLLIDRNPDIRFYTFYVQRLSDTKFHPLNPYYKNADNGRSIQYFRDNLPQGLSLASLDFTNINDSRLFFKTDHHWTIEGVCQAYDIIYPMLAVNYLDITPKINCAQYKTIPNVRFLGSLARDSMYPIEPEDFEISIAKLPAHQILLNGEEIQFTKLDAYLDGKIDSRLYTNHYSNIFGKISKAVEYRFPDSPNRNLLIIGSSYRSPIVPFIASHYRNTYTLDLRYEKDFSLSAFLKNHPVDDILILGQASVIFQQDEWKINP